MKLEKGTFKDLEELECLYNSLNDYLNSHVNYPGWIKDVYPVRETAFDGIKENNLYVVRNENHIIGTAILRHEPEIGYAMVDWDYEMDYQDIFVIYTFAVHPNYLNKGVGKQLMELIIEYSIEMGMRAIRLDVYEKNMPAISLYKKYGFQYIDTIDLGYGEHGLDNFELYQKLL